MTSPLFLLYPVRHSPNTSSDIRPPIKRLLWQRGMGLVLPLISTLITTPGFTQSIIPAQDNTQTRVDQAGDRYTIRGGQRSRDGENLFQSFEEFGLSEDEIAVFRINSDVENILARVVGGNASIIHGLLRVAGGDANLFLINPAGVLFGPTARLDLPGSFTATTATGIGFDNGWFTVEGEANYRSLVGNPDQFAFALADPGAVVNMGYLAVEEGQSLSLIGGTVINTGTLEASEGEILITAVPGHNRVRLSQDGSLLSLEFTPLNPLRQLSDITPASLPELLTGGNLPGASALTVEADGTIRLSSSGVEVPTEPGTAIVSGNVNTSSTTDQPGGQIWILGDRTALLSADVNASGTNGGGTVLIGGDYQGNDSVPSAQQTFVSGDSTVRADASVEGDGGRIIIWSQEATRVFGDVSARAGTVGDGGFIEISGAESLTVQGQVDAGANLGEDGTILFDPTTIRIVAGNGFNDAELDDGSIFASDPGDEFVIGAARIGVLAAEGNVFLAATDDIILESSIITTSPGNLTFEAGDDFLGDGFNITLAGGTLTINAGGDITLDDIDTGFAIGETRANYGGDINLEGINITVGDITTRGVTTSGQVTITASGNVLAGDIVTASFYDYDPGAGGDVTITGTDIAADTIRTSSPRISGDISLITTTGDIVTDDLDTSSFSYYSFSTDSNTAGDVTVNAATGLGNVTITSIDATGSSFGSEGTPTGVGGDVSVRGDRVRVIGTISSEGGPSIDVSGDATNGSVTITHGGGPNNVPFRIGLSGVNGTADSIRVGDETLSVGAFAVAEAGDTNTPIPGVTINSVNSAPNTPSTPNPFTFQPDQTELTLSLADLGIDPSATGLDPNNDNTRIEVVSIAPGATLTRNGVVLSAGAVFIPQEGDVFVYTPPPGSTGSQTAFELARVDLSNGEPTLARSPNVPVQVTFQTTDTPPPDEGPDQPDRPTRPNRPNRPDRPTRPDRDDTEDELPDDPQIDTEIETPDPIAFPPGEVVDTPLDTTYVPLEQGFTGEFSSYLGVDEPPLRTVDEARDIAQEIEDRTGARPAFVYINFVPAGISLVTDNPLPQDTDQLELVIVSARGNIIRRRIPEATRAMVMAEAQEFRRWVASPTALNTPRYLPSAQQLYDWLIDPIQSDLEARQITNLVFLPAAGLRSLPFAALHDGEQFLVEHYSIGLMPSLSLTDTSYVDVRDSQMLALGISESTQGQTPLPAVPTEVNTLTLDLWQGGQVFLNSDATLENLRTVRTQQPFGIIHLATHADFVPGEAGESYIQLWNEKLHMDEVRNLGWNNPPVEMLVLSACRTALGNEEAELGFAGLAVQTGVKTAVASLWYVSDAGTAALMTGFYNTLNSAPIKAEALRQAQLAMLRGEVYLENGQLVGIPGVDNLDIPAAADTANGPLSHPYYWAAFTIVGNPW